ncbi:heterokaryon incompatibility protein-domain-containing protein [Podospora didyma]|uniref:Heterokaryon incompatibility protein-domain-containing protein n=1 Tax=Podospora didyma TaxID=330526 RepID=A0AAE0NUH2_9PEZI|nr:heterokaryon incompatibility protein-domain-containing protein [Podospora didyma]
MSFIESPEWAERRKKHGGIDFSNAFTVGIDRHKDDFCVSYIRGPVASLILRLSEPAPDAKHHVYQPLPPSCIRLLRRVPQAAADANTVLFEFVIYNLEDNSIGERPFYSAISYCWGSHPTKSKLALADGSYLPITAKVATILTRLVADRPKVRAGVANPPLLWLDAVCINQADAAEKGSQIPLMAYIYRRASCVEVWLEEDEGLKKVIHQWAEGTSSSSKLHVHHNPERSSPFTPYRTHKVLDVMWSSWFERAWVLQEFCFGTIHRFHYRDLELWPLFLDYVLQCGNDPKFSRLVDEGRGNCQIPVSPMVRNYSRFRALRQSQAHGTIHTLEDILCVSYGLKATDPRDKIFAMLNLARREFIQDIKPDYTIPAPDIYLQTMMSIFARGTSFSLLGYCGLALPRPLFEAENRKRLPTWVPDFSTPPPHSVWSDQPGRFKATYLPANTLVVPRVTFWHVPSRLPGNDDDDDDCSRPTLFGPSLKPYGRFIGKVAGMIRGDQEHNMALLPSFISNARAKVISLQPYPTTRQTDAESTHSVSWKTLIASNPEYLKRDPAGKGFDELVSLLCPTQNDTMTASQDSNTPPQDNITPPQGKNSTPKISSSLAQEAWTAEGSYFQAMLTEGTGASRGLFWTTNSNTTHTSSSSSSSPYVGLAANGVEEGDEVWLIIGAKVPFILRPTLSIGSILNNMSRANPESSTTQLGRSEAIHPSSSSLAGSSPRKILDFQLVCEAYVHGIMNGEVRVREGYSEVLCIL